MRDNDQVLLEKAYQKILEGVGGAYRFPVDGEINDEFLVDGIVHWVHCEWNAGLYSDGELDEASFVLNNLKVSVLNDSNEEVLLDFTVKSGTPDTIVSEKHPELAEKIDNSVKNQISEYINDHFGDYDIGADIEDVRWGI